MFLVLQTVVFLGLMFVAQSLMAWLINLAFSPFKEIPPKGKLSPSSVSLTIYVFLDVSLSLCCIVHVCNVWRNHLSPTPAFFIWSTNPLYVYRIEKKIHFCISHFSTGKILDPFVTIDYIFIAHNKIVTTLFIYHIDLFVWNSSNVEWDMNKLTIFNSLGSFVGTLKSIISSIAMIDWFLLRRVIFISTSVRFIFFGYFWDCIFIFLSMGIFRFIQFIHFIHVCRLDFKIFRIAPLIWVAFPKQYSNRFFTGLYVFYDLVYTNFHRLLHVRWLYPLIHKHHHRQVGTMPRNFWVE